MPILSLKSNIMKNTSTLILSLFATLLFFTSCKKNKDDDDQNVPKTKTELLASGTWKFNKAMVGTIDITNSPALKACQKDNILTFQANGNGTIDEGGSKCNTGDNQINPFTWNFTTSEAVLHVSAVFFDGGSNDYNVIEISETKLVGSQTISGQVVTVTFVH